MSGQQQLRRQPTWNALWTWNNCVCMFSLLRCASSAKLKNRYANAVGESPTGEWAGGSGWAMEPHNLYKRNATHTHIDTLPPVLLSFGEFKCHTRIERYAWPVCHSSSAPASHLSAPPFPSSCCCPLPRLIAKRARAHSKHSSCLFFRPVLPPSLSTHHARIEQMPKNVTAPRTITTVNCGRGWGGQHRHSGHSSGQFFKARSAGMEGFVFVASHSLPKQANRVCVCV